jgi:hypothetical protein
MKFPRARWGACALLAMIAAMASTGCSGSGSSGPDQTGQGVANQGAVPREGQGSGQAPPTQEDCDRQYTACSQYNGDTDSCAYAYADCQAQANAASGS